MLGQTTNTVGLRFTGRKLLRLLRLVLRVMGFDGDSVNFLFREAAGNTTCHGGRTPLNNIFVKALQDKPTKGVCSSSGFSSGFKPVPAEGVGSGTEQTGRRWRDGDLDSAEGSKLQNGHTETGWLSDHRQRLCCSSFQSEVQSRPPEGSGSDGKRPPRPRRPTPF